MTFGRWTFETGVCPDRMPRRKGMIISYERPGGGLVQSFPVPKRPGYKILWPLILWRSIKAVRELDRAHAV